MHVFSDSTTQYELTTAPGVAAAAWRPIVWIIASLVAFACAGLLSPDAHAGAWTLPRGAGQAIITSLYYTVDERFDDSGARVRQPRFTKFDTEAYVQYGVTDDVTAGVQASLQHLTADTGQGGSQSSTGLGPTDLFVRGRLWHGPYSVVSLQGLVKLPNPNRSAAPALGFGQTDVELRLLGGHSGHLGPATYFVDLEGALRKRFSDPADQARVDVTVGLRPRRDWLLMLQSFNAIGLGNASGPPQVVQTNGLNARRHQLELSVVLNVTDSVGLQAGALRDVAGRDSGAGWGAIGGLWLQF